MAHVPFDASRSPVMRKNSRLGVVASSSSLPPASSPSISVLAPNSTATTDEVEQLRKEVRRLAQDRGKIDRELSRFSNQISTLQQQIDEKDLNISQLSANLEVAKKLALTSSPRSPNSDTSFNISDISCNSDETTTSNTSVLVMRQATPAVRHMGLPDGQQQKRLEQMQLEHEQQQHLLEQNKRQIMDLEAEIRQKDAQLDNDNRTIAALTQEKEQLQLLLAEQHQRDQTQHNETETDPKVMQPGLQDREALLAELPRKLESLRRCVEMLSPLIEDGQIQLMTAIKANRFQDRTPSESGRISDKLNILKTKLEAQKKLSNQLRQEFDFLRPIIDSQDYKPLSRVWVLVLILCYFVFAAITVYIVFLSAPTFRFPK